MNRVPIEKRILSENDRIAATLRARFQQNGTLCLNLISSPGSGKTALLEKTLESFAPSRRVAVLTGDIQTEADADRLKRFGFPVRQITTGGVCHLDARMIDLQLADLPLDRIELLFVENVGNLVCPSSYDLGEAAKVVLLSVTEGEEKPLKYPVMFRAVERVLVNKIDLLPHLDFDLDRFLEHLRAVNPLAEVHLLSARTGEGIDAWCDWLTAPSTDPA